VSREAGSYRAVEELRGLESELERLRAQVLLIWQREARLLGLVPQARITALDTARPAP
jgi:hypothetical protein